VADVDKVMTTRSWKTDPTLSEATMVVRHELTTKDAGTPEQVVEDEWTAKLKSGTTELPIADAATEQEMFDKLNDFRAMVVEARDGLAGM
jgi:hypothetical protein